MNESEIQVKRIERLAAMVEREGGKAAAGRKLGYRDGAFVGQMLRGERPITEKTVLAVHGLSGYAGWFAHPGSASGAETNPASAPHAGPSEIDGDHADMVIVQYAAGGGMDTQGQLLLDDQPGIIRSWRVSQDWLRLNVPNHTGVRNLCIVTGFGPSMRPMFNPGDPLLVDTGVKVVNNEGVYFFRVGDEGFIKMIQRVPDPNGAGVTLQVISKNPDYPPYPMSPKNPHFEVLGKVLTVWRSEQH